MFSSYCVSKCHTTHFDHLRRLYFVPKEFVGEFGLPSSHRNDRWQHHPQHHHNQPTKPTKHQQQHQQKDQQQHQQQHQYQWQQQSIQQQQSRFSRNISSNISVATSVVTITLSSTLIVNEYICKVRFYPIQKKISTPLGQRCTPFPGLAFWTCSFWYGGTIQNCAQKQKQGPGWNTPPAPRLPEMLYLFVPTYLTSVLLSSLQNTECHITTTTTHNHCATNVHHVSNYLKSCYGSDKDVTRLLKHHDTSTFVLISPKHLVAGIWTKSAFAKVIWYNVVT